ncbi:MAG: hypothetical protein IIC22_06865, partial [Chloroflexi bacterium]|nr:hypothetical protein [Chloroflexota bacterium]
CVALASDADAGEGDTTSGAGVGVSFAHAAARVINAMASRTIAAWRGFEDITKPILSA